MYFYCVWVQFDLVGDEFVGFVFYQQCGDFVFVWGQVGCDGVFCIDIFEGLDIGGVWVVVVECMVGDVVLEYFIVGVFYDVFV